MVAQIVPREILCKSALNKTGIPGYEFCMNPYVGCTHSCVYCYASFMCRFTEHRERWGEFLDVKVNFPEVLEKQLARRRTRPGGRILIGTVTDAYQPVEARYEITRASLKVLTGYPLLEVNVLTKSDMVQRDIAILGRLRVCKVGFTITTMDQKVSRVFEPGAATPQRRLDAARQLLRAGIPVWIFIAPLLPGLTDTEKSLAVLYQAVRESGIKEIRLDYLNPYPAVVYRLKNIYRRYFPKALGELERYLQHPGFYRNNIDSLLYRFK